MPFVGAARTGGLSAPSVEDVDEQNRRFLAALEMQFQLLGRALKKSGDAAVDAAHLLSATSGLERSNAQIADHLVGRLSHKVGASAVGGVLSDIPRVGVSTKHVFCPGDLGLAANIDRNLNPHAGEASAQAQAVQEPTGNANLYGDTASTSAQVVRDLKRDTSPNGDDAGAQAQVIKDSSVKMDVQLPSRAPSATRIRKSSQTSYRALEAVSSDPYALQRFADSQLEHGWKQRLQLFVLWRGVDAFVGLTIFFNAILIGIETSARSEGTQVPVVVEAFGHLFFAVYAAELAARFVAFGWQIFQSRWVQFDGVMVLVGMCNIVLELMVSSGQKHFAGDANGIVEKIMLGRVLRLARLARLFRLLVQFKMLWLLVVGLMHSMLTLVWVFVIITVCLYVFAILGLELIREDPSSSEQYNDAVKEYFGDLPRTAVTLLAGLSLDSISNVYTPIIWDKPWLLIYFILYILVVCLALMNLITALMVESSMQQAAADKEVRLAWETAQKRKTIDELGVLFTEMDQDSSGTLDFDELRNAPPDIHDRLEQLLQNDDWCDVEDFFRALDSDNSGTLSIEEFLEGLTRVLSGTPVELIRIMKQNQSILQTTETTGRYVKMSRKLDRSLPVGAMRSDGTNGRNFAVN